MVRPVKGPSELRGALAAENEEQGKSATKLLQKEREQDKTKTDETYGLSEQEE